MKVKKKKLHQCHEKIYNTAETVSNNSAASRSATWNYLATCWQSAINNPFITQQQENIMSQIVGIYQPGVEDRHKLRK